MRLVRCGTSGSVCGLGRLGLECANEPFHALPMKQVARRLCRLHSSLSEIQPLKRSAQMRSGPPQSLPLRRPFRVLVSHQSGSLRLRHFAPARTGGAWSSQSGGPRDYARIGRYRQWKSTLQQSVQRGPALSDDATPRSLRGRALRGTGGLTSHVAAL